ncbi:MAG: hypothetical protein RBS77_05390 [Candidatus Moranbacteria bacterium]|jgi:hypothetical protein|nr:hypothetical protein [Candidatus Moranbacteria bacterium]
MANMRDKLRELMGKKIEVESGEGSVSIRSPRYDFCHDKIIEVGDDYFVVRTVRIDKKFPDRENTYAISGIKKIEGGL